MRRIITNAGASGALTLNLPDALTALNFVLSVSTAQTIDVNPETGDQILGLTNAAGDAISSDTNIGSAVELVAIDANNWLPIRKVGTWTDVN